MEAMPRAMTTTPPRALLAKTLHPTEVDEAAHQSQRFSRRQQNGAIGATGVAAE